MRPLRRGAAAAETLKKSRRRAAPGAQDAQAAQATPSAQATPAAPAAPGAPGAAWRGQAIAALRRAASLYLANREAASRDIAFLVLPDAGQDRRSASPPGRRGVHPGAADLLIWTGGRGLAVGLCPARGRCRLAQEVFSETLRRLGHEYRLIRAETPAHAVEQLEQLIDAAARDPGLRIWEKP